MNKTKVLVFTRQDRWNSLSRELHIQDAAESWTASFPNNPTDIREFQFDSNQACLVPVDLEKNPIADKEGIFLIYDQLDQSDFAKLKNQCEGDNIYVLAHINGSYSHSNFDNWNCQNVREGSHMIQDNCYPHIFKILTDREGNKMDRIIKKVFKPSLEIILRYLHNCLVDTQDVNNELRNNQYNIILGNLPNGSEERRVLEEYHQKSSPSYEDLSVLRDKLLDYALAQN